MLIYWRDWLLLVVIVLLLLFADYAQNQSILPNFSPVDSETLMMVAKRASDLQLGLLLGRVGWAAAPVRLHHMGIGPNNALFASNFVTNQLLRFDELSKQWLVFVDGKDLLDGATGFTFDEKTVYISSFGTDQVLMFDVHNGRYLGVFTQDDRIDCPEGLIWLDHHDEHTIRRTMIVASFLNNRILQFDEDGELIQILMEGSRIAGPQMFDVGMSSSSSSSAILYVSAYLANQVVALDIHTGKTVAVLKSSNLVRPVGVLVGFHGDILVSSHASNKILRFNGTTGKEMGEFAYGHGLWAPTGIVMAPSLVVHVASYTDGLFQYSYWI